MKVCSEVGFFYYFECQFIGKVFCCYWQQVVYFGVCLFDCCVVVKVCYVVVVEMIEDFLGFVDVECGEEFGVLIEKGEVLGQNVEYGVWMIVYC